MPASSETGRYSPAELEQKWWESWWERDYSWEGLSRRSFPHNGDARRHVLSTPLGGSGLQSYWRADIHDGHERSDEEMAAELIQDSEGKLWHIAHVPMRWTDGTPAKEAWSSEQRNLLARTLGERCAHAALAPKQADYVAWLEGIITWEIDFYVDELHALLESAYIKIDMGFPNMSDFTKISNCYFGDYVNFRGILFNADIDFSNNIVRGQLTLWELSSNVGMKLVDNVVGNILIEKVRLGGNIDLSRCVIRGPTLLKQVIIGDQLELNGSLFNESLSLSDVIIEDKLDLASAVCYRATEFKNVKVGGILDFSKTTFYGSVSFPETTIQGKALFESVLFSESADFRNVAFAGRVNFSSASFLQSFSFESCDFLATAFFDDCNWGSSAHSGPAPPPYEKAFYNAHFKGAAVFRKIGFRCFSAFDGVIFDGAVHFDHVSEKEAAASFREELSAARQSGTGAADRLESLRAGCHALRHAMEKASDKRREALLYQFELRTRRYQSKYPKWERVLSSLYGAASDYGSSIGRPLSILVAVLFLFGIGYALIGAPAASPSRFFEGLSYSAGRAFPFGPWMVEDEFLRRLMGTDATAETVLVRSLATLQSILSAILLFLAALAVRRRFQIG